MKKAKRCLIAVVSGVLVATAILSGCGQSKKEISKNDDHLTVYLWENRLIKNIAPYIHEQFPDQDIEFIIGNNDTDLYSYFKEHDELPDIITVRRFSGTDAQDLQPYLMDFASYDVVSKYYSYALQYYKNAEDEIQWLPICGIPQTIIANKTLFDQYGIKIPKNYEEYVQACQQFYVGTSTQKISPRLYMTFGSSGAPQHMTGVRNSKLIVAVNNDAEAPIFRACAYGIVGDAAKILPVLTQAVKQL